MKYIFLFFALINATLSFGQSTSDLDARNGIKDFTIGDDISKWKQYLTVNQSTGDTVSYFYNGTCCKSIFGYPIDGVMMRFKNAKLERITLYLELQKPYSETGQFNKWRSSDFEKINGELKHAFGKPSEMSNDGSESVFYAWYGKKISLLSLFTYLGDMDGANLTLMLTEINSKSDF